MSIWLRHSEIRLIRHKRDKKAEANKLNVYSSFLHKLNPVCLIDCKFNLLDETRGTV